MDQRLIATSAVRCVGNTLLLQGRTYSPPFVITAVVDTAAVRAQLAASPQVAVFQQAVEAFGLTYEVRERNEVELPAYDGPLDLEYASRGLTGGARAPRHRRSGDRREPHDRGPPDRPVLVVDNFDSFVYNLVQYLGQLGVRCIVRRNDAVTVDELADLDVAGVLLSPGPGTPAGAGVTVPMVHAAAEAGMPVLGVCLGHQAIAEAFGAVVVRAPELLHGKTSQVVHEGAGVLAGLPVAVHRDPLPLARRRPGHRARRARGHRATRRRGSSWRCGTASCRSRACSSTPSRCSPRAGTGCWPPGSTTCGLAPDPAVVDAAAAAVRRLSAPRPERDGPAVGPPAVDARSCDQQGDLVVRGSGARARGWCRRPAPRRPCRRSRRPRAGRW